MSTSVTSNTQQGVIVYSPISGKIALKVDTIPVSVIEESYQATTGIDVSSYFNGLDEVSIYQCQETGYRFYYPMNLDGDAVFYEALQKFDWYYMDWKWDYDQSVPYISDNCTVLDVGCGSGRFIKYLRDQKGCRCVGLEFNDKAIKTALADQLDIRKEFVQQHSEDPSHKYDIVCTFQVLEHIAEAGDFLEHVIKCVKPGGLVIICVPNNTPYFFSYDKYHTLNMPPHHMNMWNKDSMEALGRYYGITTVNIHQEPLSRFRFYSKVYLEHLYKLKPGLRNFHFLNYPLTILKSILNRKKIFAGSIMGVYRVKG